MTARHALVAVTVGAAVALGVWTVGLRPVDAVVVGVVTAVLTTVGRTLDDETEHRWRPPPPDEPDGARSAVSTLMWGFAGRDGKVSESALRHLRRQAGRRLAATGIALDDGRGYLLARTGTHPGDDARARALLGDRAWAVLTGRGDLPTLRDVAHCIDAVERLDPDHPERRR
ncbi:hypothetical protein [uncultured Cellulomonas sp.]|uniref:hypothetical protein n=1 Tax=uncultured Cellulomonas sp. TaxID=189682 RepID=UPI00262955FD|nr:hypothetical protein [uncultured Cellulomonas sp.]